MQLQFVLPRARSGAAAAVQDRAMSPARLWQAFTLLLFSVGAVMGAVIHVDDVSWLITCGERMLDGHRLYVDIFEVNPPLSVLLYLPAVALSRVVGIQPELLVDAMVVGAAALSLRLTGALLGPVIGPDPERRWKLAAAGAFVLVVMPTACFAQREHLAVIGLLPFVALCVARAEGKAPAWPWMALAGLTMGLAVCIKPHFAAVAALPALWAAWKGRSWRFWTQVDLWAAAVVAVGYLAIVLLVFPAYFRDLFPMVRDAYLPVRYAPWALLTVAWGGPIAAVAVLAAFRTRLPVRWLAAPFLGAFGGALAFVAQGKGWPYHGYPMLAFACLGLFSAAIMAWREGERTWARRAWIVLPALFSMGWFIQKDDFSALAGLVRAVSPAPRMLYLGTDASAAFPMVRDIGGRWVGTESGLWMFSGARFQEKYLSPSASRRRRLDELVRFERRLVAHDISTGHPDVILVDSGMAPLALADPDLGPALRPYRPVSAADGVQVWAHRPPAG